MTVECESSASGSSASSKRKAVCWKCFEKVLHRVKRRLNIKFL